MKSKYRHLFFDLDHTLWDFEKNANETLHTLYERHDFARYGTFSVDEFIRVYSDINHALWRLYQSNKITQTQLRDVRFTRTLTRLGLTEDQIPADISAEFTDILPLKSAVFPYTHEVPVARQGSKNPHGFSQADSSCFVVDQWARGSSYRLNTGKNKR